MHNTAAMILAGGRGSRMDILCAERPKPLLPFAAGLRVIDFTLNNSINSGIRSISVLVDYQRQVMEDYLKRWAGVNARKIDFHIMAPGTGSYLGTADAIYQNVDCLKAGNPKNLLVLAGDHIYKMDYRAMLAFHELSGADVTIGVVPVTFKDCSRFGIVALDSDNRVIGFEEKPAVPKSNLASMGIYMFNTRVLIDRLVEDSKQTDSRHDFGHSIIPGLVKGNRVFAYKFGGYWKDVGTAEAYHEANMDMVRQFSPLSLDKPWPVLSADTREPSLKVWNSGNINRSIVSRGCVIKGKVVNSLLAPGVVVDYGAVVRNSVVMANTFIGTNSRVDRCILDEEINIGQSCRIGPIPGSLTILGKRRIVQSNCSMPYNPAMRDAVTRVSPEASVHSLAMAY